MDRRTEDRIRKLCADVIAESDPEKTRALSLELRTELHRFISELRALVSAYPVVADRRTESGVPSPGTVLEGASETTSASLRASLREGAAKVPVR